MPRRTAAEPAQTQIAPKTRKAKPLDDRIAETRATLAKLEAEARAQRAASNPKLARALRSFEHVAPFLTDEVSEAIRETLEAQLDESSEPEVAEPPVDEG